MFFHGSTYKIEEFSDKFVGEGHDQHGPGIYLTSSFEKASVYGPYVHSIIIRSDNELSSDPSDKSEIDREKLEKLIKNAPNWEMVAQSWAEDPYNAIDDIIEGAIEFNEHPFEVYQQIWIDFYRNSHVEYVRNLVDLGFDYSVIEKEGGIKDAVVFNPDVLKIKDIEYISDDERQNIQEAVGFRNRMMKLSGLLNESEPPIK